MENKNVLIGAVLIILVAMLSFNLDMTGQAIKTATKVSVSPSIVDAGDVIDITVTPGKEGVEKQFDIYCNGLRKAKDLNLCELDSNERDAKTCFSEQTYRYLIRTDEKSGECYAEFTVISSFDNVLEKVRGYFTIR